MPISTNNDNRQWPGFDVYDLEAARKSGMTDQQIRDELISGGFSASLPPGDDKRIGPDAYASLFSSANSAPSTTPVPSLKPTPTPTPIEPPRPVFPDAPYAEWDFYYGKMPGATESTEESAKTFTYTNFAKPPEGQMMNDFATSFMADNSAYTDPMYMPQTQINTSQNQDPSIFEQVMRSNTKNLNVDPQTFQNIISNS